MFGGLGIWELLLIFFIILLFFGARRLPEIGSSLGKGIREFKDSLKEGSEEGHREIPPNAGAGENRPPAGTGTERRPDPE